MSTKQPPYHFNFRPKPRGSGVRGKKLPKALLDYRAESILRNKRIKITLPPTPWDAKP